MPAPLAAAAIRDGIQNWAAQVRQSFRLKAANILGFDALLAEGPVELMSVPSSTPGRTCGK